MFYSRYIYIIYIENFILQTNMFDDYTATAASTCISFLYIYSQFMYDDRMSVAFGLFNIDVTYMI